MTATASQFPEISSYTITEQLYLGSRTAVYRGVLRNQQLPVVIKVLQREYPTFGELVQFRNQYAIAKNLPIAGIIQPLKLETFGNGYVLVMEDWGGISLDKYIQQQPLDLIEKLAIAIQLTDILDDLHSSRVIHKDIKPANILIHPESKQVKLIDFSIASLLPKETQEIQNPNVLEGTLAYLAPEQTGRMNRGIDYRSDFYAFGVTLYQLLADSLPFDVSEPLELVHCHIAKIATPVHQVNTDVPEILGLIIAKLMAKNAEERYQSALGLKHDLGECLNQWKETGSIAKFDLGQRDLCDKFIIPEKLYGRGSEVQTLLDAFERVAQGLSELILVAGFSGIGKTAVVNEVHKPITRQKGYFIKGKFDQFNRNIPFSAFVQAFRSLMGQLLSESDTEIQEWKSKILEAVGESGQVLIEVIPELERIIGSQPSVPELSGSAAQNRFNLLFQKFIAVFTTPEHPLVIFLDDLQWADSASLNLLNLLIAESETGYLLVLGAYRDNEVFPTHPLMFTLEDIKKRCDPVPYNGERCDPAPYNGARESAPREYQAQIHTLTLKPLAETHINHLVADTLLCTTELAAPLGELIYQKTQGNPFFTTQFLQGLYEEECITFNPTVGYWQCNLSQVRQLALTDDVVEFMVMRLRKLPEETQHILKLAACIGNQFDLSTLAVVCQKSGVETAADLWRSLQDGLVIPENETYKFFYEGNHEAATDNEIRVGYRFLHDRVQQAAYSLIPDQRKCTTHYHIGQLLLDKFSASAKQERIFDLVNQLNYGINLITNTSERYELATLNLQVAQKAKSATAYKASLDYLKNGMQLLAPDKWKTQHALTLEIYIEATECAYLNGDLQLAEEYSELVLGQDIPLLDTIKIYELRISQKISQQKAEEALEISLQVLEALGMSQEQITHYSEEGGIVLPQLEDLENGHHITSSSQLAIIRLLLSATSAATIAKPELLLPIIATQVQISLEIGYSEFSAFAYSWYGLLLCGYLGEIDEGNQAGHIAIKLIEIFETKSLECQVMSLVYQFIFPWKNHLKKTLEPSVKAFQIGLENGDLIYASYSASNYCINLFLTGLNLDSLLGIQSSYIEVLKRKKIDYTIRLMSILKQLNLNLQGLSENPLQMVGEAVNEFSLFNDLPKQGDAWGLLLLHIAKEFLLYLLGDYEGAIWQSKQARNYLTAVGGWTPIGVQNFYDSLSLLALFPDADESTQKRYLEEVTKNQEKMSYWAKVAPMNHQHKVDLVEAEKCRVLAQKIGAIELYDKAIAGAKANEYLQEEALANELVAKFYLDWGKEKVAASYMQEAYYCYSRWGAKAKTDDLEKRYPELLRPILQSAEVSDGNWNTLKTISPLSTSVHSSSTSINQALDFAAILKASQALSRKIEIDQLLHQLTQIILQNSGGDYCALVLPNETGEWQVRAITTLDDTLLSVQPLTDNPNLPVKLIQYVKNTQEVVVINELKTDLPVIDDYLRQNQPKSLLFLPLLNQGQLIGILYLENHSSIGAFTSNRVEVLNFLTTQAAISLENARLYQQAQEYARQLEQSQLQVVQSEKMASLGNLVAGVAHEINNPIGFLNGSISNGKDYVQDLFEYLEIYHQQQTPNPEVEEFAKDIDLEYLLEDLPKLLESMQGATNRIKGISTSLRTFSRADTDYKVSANLHEGIDSTLLILKYRLKANDCRPAIQVTKDYGDLPIIKCFPGQLNQVFMNTLANAIDMFDEMAQTQSYHELETNPQRITIRTQIESNQVYIRIRDNGKGMSENVQAKIFDHLFTTKEVGKGTGLGLAIAYQIVVDAHNGSIDVQSEVGEGTEFCICLPIL